MGKNSKTSPRGRNAINGRFTSVKTARNKPRIHTVEQVPKPGFGDTDK